MKKTTHKIKTRICSLGLIASMLVGLLPMSAIIALATENYPVAVTWEPQTQVENHTRDVSLTASLDVKEGISAAMIEIMLDKDEASALMPWGGETIDADDLQGEEPGQPEESGSGDVQDSDSSTQTGETDSSDTNGDTSNGGTDVGGPNTGTGSEESDSGEDVGNESDEEISAPDTSAPDAATEGGNSVEGGTEESDHVEEDIEDNEEADEVSTDDSNVEDSNVSVAVAGSSGDDGDSSAQNTDTSTEDTETEEPMSLALVYNDPTPSTGAVLITNADETGGAVLRILLVGGSQYIKNLTFDSEAELDVAVVESDIRVQTYSETTIPGLTTAPLLGAQTGNQNADITTQPFTVYESIPAEVTVSTQEDSINLEDELKGGAVTYAVSIQKPGLGEGDKQYSFTVSLPGSLSLPEGELTAVKDENGYVTIQCGVTTIATLGLPKDQDFSLQGNFPVETTGNGFAFTVNAPGKWNAEDETYDFSLTLQAGNLVRSTEAVSGEITLTVSAADEETPATDSASVFVTAGEDFPGLGDWPVVPTGYESVTQPFFWADNNNAERPTWSSTLGGADGMTPKLYFTLTEVDEEKNPITVYQPLELTQETLQYVGLTAMPALSPALSSEGGVLSVNVGADQQGLPSRLEEQADTGDVQGRYTVSWSLEPPEPIPDGYTLQEIERGDPEIEDGSVSGPGWYFVLLRDFTITVDVLQGNAEDLDSEQVLELLNNFSIHWDYDGMPAGAIDQSTLADLLENGLTADYDAETGKLTISGLWQYSLSGSEIIYRLQETADDGEGEEDLADGRLSGGELGTLPDGEDAPLEENDWYNILYNNTGVPNYGGEDTAVYSGGTLTLVRGGETQYTATKIWRDAYEQNVSTDRPKPTFTLYRYLRGQAIGTASVYDDGVDVELVWVNPEENPDEDTNEGSDEDTGEGGQETGETADGHWEIQVQDSEGKLAALPQYDSQSGGEWIYVVRENPILGYEQVFGTVDWVDGEWVRDPESLDKWDALREGNDYLYNRGTLTNLQTGTVAVGATKEWKAATFQSSLSGVAVELTLQVREKGSEDGWTDYKDRNDESMHRYLFDFSAVSLTDSLAPGDTPAMEQYAGGDKTKELEYRWLETAVYTGVYPTEGQTIEDAIVTECVSRIEVTYTGSDETSSCTENEPVGTFAGGDAGRTWTVTYERDEDGGVTAITNSVQDEVSYEVIKEWHEDTTPEKITLQIYRAVTGEDFDYSEPYLKFTMDGDTLAKTGGSVENDDPETYDNISVESVEGLDGYPDSTDETITSWLGRVSGLPAYDDEGRTYEYILLEKTEGGGTAVYHNVETNTADYRTIVVNGGPGEGFNLLVRKTWLDDSDTPHREPVTFTLYNKNTDEPVRYENGNSYTITLGVDNIWSSVFWVGIADLAPESITTEEGGNDFGADDVYLVETSVGLDEGGHDAHPVVHHLGEADGGITYDALYKDGQGDDGHIFDVTTENHRYQVTYEAVDTESAAEGALPDGVEAAFTITNRRLGSIDLTVNKTWIDGRATLDGGTEQVDPTLSQEIANELKKIAKRGGKQLALVFRLVFDDSMGKTEDDAGDDGWEITHSGPGGEDTVSVGGEPVDILGQDSTQVSSDQVIIGLTQNDEGAFTTVTNDHAYFFNLPKYDAQGNVVSYSVEEIWLDVTNDKNIEPVDLEQLAEDNKNLYGDLCELWSGYTDPEYEWTYTENVEDNQNTKDEQTLDVTNRRGTPKTVEWTKSWKDNYANNNNLRPDLYLDIYRVVHVQVNDAAGNPPSDKNWTPTYQRRIEYYRSSGDWERVGGTWTLTLDNVQAFDAHGFEIYYYAVERTTQPASRYDYQAGKYSLGDRELGTRDFPLSGEDESVTILQSGGESTPGDIAYDLLVLGKQNPKDTAESGNIPWAEDHHVQGAIGVFGTDGSLNYAKYALIEGGTFTNTLAEDYSIDGMKYWTNLPSQWDTNSRLPGVKFLVYRYTQSDKDQWGVDTDLNDLIKNEDGTFKETDGTYYEFAAELTIPSEQWQELKSGNGYRYLIRYNGVNKLTVTEENGLTCNGTEGAAHLERYDENGELYTYEIREVVQWPEGVGNVQGSDVFTVSQAANGFYFTNDYDPEEGSIQVKKFLYLPMGEDNTPEAYPAVTFRLERLLQNADGDSDYSTDGWSQDVTLTSAQVQKIWENSGEEQVIDGAVIASGKDETDAYIWATLEFDELPLYAPDGTAYQYQISEVKTSLNDYDTWGVREDVTEPDTADWDNVLTVEGGVTTPITGLTPEQNDSSVDAMFKNQRTKTPQTHSSFVATKSWEDNNSNFRPSTEEFAKLLTLTRTAAQQGVSGGAAAMKEILELDKDYTISISPENSTEHSEWTITIRPASGTTFEKYAPNGMTWTYTLQERVNQQTGRLQITDEVTDDRNKVYTPSSSTGVWPARLTAASTNESKPTGNFGRLTNSTLTHADFTKVWWGSDGQITEDYLGFDLTVNFQLQVREMDSEEEWTDAREWNYDGGRTLGLEGRDTSSLTGPIVGAEHGWTYVFVDLPSVVQDENNNYIFLEYRVIETSVSWGNKSGQSQTIELPETGADEASFNYKVTESLVTSATFSRSSNTSTSTNVLKTTSVSVTKVWDDGDNQYGTRPGAAAPWSWASWFVLQRSTDDTNWENVAVFEKLYGGQESSESVAEDGNWTAEITDLPTTDYRSAQPYTYRVRELQPKEGGYTLRTVNHDDIVEPGGIYNKSGVNYTASYPDTTGNAWTVTNSLNTPPVPDDVPQNVRAVKEWAGGEEIAGSVTFQLEYTTNGTDWAPASFLSGYQKAAIADNNWTVEWTTLPSTDGSATTITGYRVVELPGSGWVQIDKPTVSYETSTGTTTYAYIFTNSVPISYAVEKEWLGSAATPAVTLGLYRTTVQGSVGSASGEAVPADELNPSSTKRTVVLDGTVDEVETAPCCSTFTNLPKYDANSQLYYYYVLELDSSGNPVPQNGKIVLNAEDYEVSYDWTTNDAKTTVTNTTAISLTGTKTWVDNSDAYHTRPDSLTLILERWTGDSGSWDDVSSRYAPSWEPATGGDSNVWTYTYTGLPSCDADGTLYSYRVREVVPNGYELTNRKTGGENGEVIKEGDRYNFINVLSEKINIVGQKVWSGGVGAEPTLTLERRLYNQTPEDEWESVLSNPTWTKTGDSDTWTFTYTDLPKYNERGVLYEYRVRESTAPDSYEAGYKDGTIGSAITGHPDTPVDGLTITNYKDGNLTVSKTVSGNRGDQSKEFTFTVKLTGNSSAGTAASSINDSYTISRTDAQGNTTTDTILFTSGVSATFTLRHNESVTIWGLPAGIGYLVTETGANRDGYTTSGTGWNGTIPAGSTAEAEFNNYSHDSGGGEEEDERIDLTGRKTWVDDGQDDPARPKVIELVLERSIDGVSWEQYHAWLTWSGQDTNTWTYTFHNLPKTDSDGNTYRYRVSEIMPPGYVSEPNGNNITNRKQDTNPGSLQVTKRVTGSRGDPTREFTFTVTLGNRNLTGIYGQMTFVNGVATFTLRDGETILAENLPDGTTYTVIEAEANQDGYSTTAVGDTGTITADTVASAIFTNDRPRRDWPDDPDKPDPEYPDEPDEPDYPDEPDQPDEPDNPNNPDNPDIPRTDDPTRNDLLAMLCLSSLGGMVLLGLLSLVGRRIKKKYRGKRLR